MASRRSAVWPVTTVLIALTVIIVALPKDYKSWAPGFLRDASLHFGLDLAGGTQLDFRISEQEMEKQIEQIEQQIQTLEDTGGSQDEILLLKQQMQSITDQKQNVVEAIRTVLERRINALGVSEAVITPSYIGDEKHLLVECPGVVDTQACIATVGKTIQLEFKEEFTEATAEFETGVRALADSAMTRTRNGESLTVVGEDLGSELGVLYHDSRTYFEDELPVGLENRWAATPADGVFMQEGSVTIQEQDEDGNPVPREVPGIFIAEALSGKTQTGRLVQDAPTAFQLLEKEENGNAVYEYHENKALDSSVSPRVIAQLRSMQNGELKAVNFDDGSAAVLFRRVYEPGEETMRASHILIAYKGANSADAGITRSKDDALALAKSLKSQLDNGADFAELAAQHSDDPSGKKSGGNLGEFNREAMVAPFSQAAFALSQSAISDPVESAFGFHVIRADQAAVVKADISSYDILLLSGDNAFDRANEIISRMQRGDVKSLEDSVRWRTLFFSLLPTGWKDTTLDGKHFRTATVTLDSVTNIPVVQIVFDEEGGKIFQELTKNNVGKRIAIFVGGELVSAPVVQNEIAGGIAVITGSRNFDEARGLALDLNTGAIPAPIYLAGQRTVEATLGAEALQTSLEAALIGIAILMLYMILFYRMLGFLADLALLSYAVLFLALMKLPLFLFSDQYVVLSLAGMAGIILSIGMAVDANVLIFERMKEELRKGKTLKTAADIGFQRAWPSIRDGNVSTFITCAILFLIGTSIVKGFAITLGLGVMLSMFTAIVVTRWLVKQIAKSPLAERTGLFGA